MLASAGPPGRPLPNIPIRICELLLSITDRAGFGQDVHEANYNDAIDGCLGALHILWYFCLFFLFFFIYCYFSRCEYARDEIAKWRSGQHTAWTLTGFGFKLILIQ